MTDEVKIELVDALIETWEKDTVNLSFTDLTHPAFTLVQKLAKNDKDLVITTILKRMEKEFTFFGAVLYEIIPMKDQPVIPEDSKGKIKKIQKIWTDWGRKKGYL